MRNRPNALELLDIARKTLSEEVAKDMSKRQRYNVALIASAIAIASRELTAGILAWDDELDTLRGLYGGDLAETSDSALARLNRQLAVDLRSGSYDEKSEKQTTVLNLLYRDVLARLDEDNPGYEKLLT